VHDRRWWILSTVSIGTFMATLDGSIVNISLPSIGTAFGIDLATVEWVVVAYLLVVGSLLLPIGRLGEVLSFRTVYLAGFVLFTAASVLCGVAPGPGALIAFRAAQGVGAAMIMAMGPAIVARTFAPGERGRALGFNAVSVAVGLSVGPALGGVLTELGSWRAIFLVNLPVGLFAVAWAARILPVETERRRPAFDIPGALLLAGAFFALLLALSEGEAWGWSSAPVLGLLAVAVLLAVTFVVVELRARAPMFDLTLFRIRAFSAGLSSVVFAYVGLFAALFLLPFLLQGSSGFSPIEAGLLLTPIPLTTAVVAPFSGTLSDRIGSRLPASLGMGIMALGLALLTQLPNGFSVPDLIWRLVIIGVGQGLFTSPNSAAVLSAIPRGRMGTASGTIAQMRVTGQALGIALSGAIVTARVAVHAAAAGAASTGVAGAAGAAAGSAAAGGAAGVARALAQGLAIRDAFAVSAAICAIGILTSLVRGGRQVPEATPARTADSAPGDAS
jgi:EmrB/QacA subfamily drug resistance transporter